ncbi:pericentriolar material 1 protein isoform X3 [Pangasianodon hypophthalmus]|uniref:pericentriolar material 1 protein isoform X3 n=1 Tax=Pangasianodon hypophthalmus TaxID=310915 RepID=UPI0023075501|nr:pericentriolar material 1 protein isoform X3 [Pangasianodon hypophthalmus]
MATGGALFDDGADEQELHNWTISNGSLDDRLNNMDWGVQQKKANRSSEKNRKKLSAVSESRLTNDISPESTPGAGRRRARTPHSFPHVKYTTQMSVPDQAELERLRQRINFTDLDERSIGSDSQGRVTAANNQRQLSSEPRKPFNFLPLHVNTNKSRDSSASTPPATTTGGKEAKKQSPVSVAPVAPVTPVAPVAPDKEPYGAERTSAGPLVDGRGEPAIDSSQVVSKLVQIREYISRASSMRDDLLEKNDVPANVERLSHLITHLKEQEKSYLRFLQKMLARENEEEEDEEEDEGATVDSAVCSGSMAESASLNLEPRSEAADPTCYRVGGQQKEELENLRKQHDLLQKMLQQQEELRELQNRQAALLTMQNRAEHAMDDTVVTETTGSVSGVSITSELNDELNDLIRRFHNQLHDSQSPAVPDNRRQAESLSLSREVSRSRSTHSPRGQQTLGGGAAAAAASPSPASAKLTKLQELQDKKQTMDKILQELHSLRDQTLNNSSCRGASQRASERPSTSGRDGNGVCVPRQDSSSYDDGGNPAEKLRKLKEVHKRLNELRELVQYYEQTSDMMVDTVNENVNEDEEDETEDGSLFETMFDSEQENREPVTNIRNPAQPQSTSNWMDMNTLTNACSSSNNRVGRLNSQCDVNNRSAANLRSLNVPSVIECQYNRDGSYNGAKHGNGDEDDEDDDDDGAEEEDGARRGRRESSGSGSSRRSSIADDAEFAQKVHRLQTAKQKLQQLRELVAMVQSDDTDTTAANEDEGLQQQPNNTRATAPKAKRELTLSDKAREKLYEEKLRQQQQELKQLHEERQRLMEIQGKIQDLQWACPDLQSSVSSAASGVMMMKKLPAAASTPAVAPSTSAKSNTAVLKHTTEPAPVTITDNELWSEMRRHQVLREELRQRRKHLESLMAEQQRRSDTHPTHSFTRDDRTMATWGGSTQCPLGEEEDDEDYPSELGAQEDEDEEEEEGAESSSTDEPHSYSNRKSCSSGKNRDSVKGSSPRCTRSRPRPNPRGTKRQENLRWAADLSASESATHTHTHWQEQTTQLQRQLDFSTAMCQMLLQDQQTLSCMLQSMLTAPYNVLPNNLGSPQVPLIMHQLNQCYTQLAWQQNNVNRLKQTLNDLLRQQQQQQASSGQQQHQNVARDSVSPSPFLPFPPISTLGMNNFSPIAAGFNLSPMFPSVGSEIQQASGAQAGADLQPDPNMSLKTEYMSFPPPLQRTPLNNAHTRSQDDPKNSSWLNSSLNRSCDQRGSDQGPLDSHDSLSSMPDRVDPSTVTKTYRPGRKASAQASLASRDKTPKTRRRRGKNHNNPAGLDSDSVSSATELDHEREKGRERERERSAQPRARDPNQSLLDKLTQEKLDSKTKKHNDVSSAYAWRTPFLSNQIACTEAPDGSSDFSLFEALRETIYSEVATLISQNESRPHFLIELFHELQLLNTDYLRQRALYSLQDIVTRHLTEKSVAEEPGSSLGPGSQSELTPSESLATTDNDVSEKDVRVKLSSRRKRAVEGDSVDSESLLSTSSNLEPFASDDLGNTVIHLDKALVRMREFERMKLKAGFPPPAPPPPPPPPPPTAAAAVSTAPPVSNPELSAVPAAAAAAAGDPALNQGQDIRCPQIDTQQLDRQIKAIMTEVIPFLKEHMGEVCSPQLLTSVRRMVLTLTQQNDDSREFMRFFHKQLGGILQESLSKFVGRTLQDCGEDLLVEISEILFNELAFFRLMQDLDQNTHRAKRHTQTTPTKHTPSTEGKKSEGEKTFSPSYFDEDKDRDETEQGKTSLCLEGERERTDEKPSRDASEEEEDEEEEEEEEEEGDRLPLSISLSKAETQALNNYGSGEDENEEEEAEEFEAGSVEVQTSLQASDNTAEHSQCNGVSLNGAAQETKSDHESTESTEVKSCKSECVETMEDERDAEAANTHTHTHGKDESAVPLATPSQESPHGSTTASPQTDSPVLVNADEVGSGNTSQKSDEEDFVKVEDLPVQLSVMCQEELCKQILEEQRSNNLTREILNGNAEGLSGLVGNAHALKEPETVGAQSA